MATQNSIRISVIPQMPLLPVLDIDSAENFEDLWIQGYDKIASIPIKGKKTYFGYFGIRKISERHYVLQYITEAKFNTFREFISKLGGRVCDMRTFDF